MVKRIVKRFLFLLGLVVTSPMILLTWMEGIIMRNRSSRVFGSCKEVLSLVPTFVGEYMRLAFYWSVCTGVSPDACFMFGSMAAHRDMIVRSGTVIGVYTIIGRADIGNNVLFGAHVSLLSGKYQHGRPGERAESRETPMDFQLIKIGDNSWIGQDSIIMANVGENCTVGAGSVVYKEVPNNTTVLGNPARKVNL